MPEAYLSATLAKNFRFIWFMSSLGVHSPCFWINVTTIFFSNFLTLSHRNVLNSSIQFPNWILNSRSLWEILNRKRITIRVYRLYIYGIVPDYVPCFCIESQISPKEYLTLKVIFLHESVSKNSMGGFGNNPIYPLLSTWISTWTEFETYFGKNTYMALS